MKWHDSVNLKVTFGVLNLCDTHNFSAFTAFSALTLLVGWQEGHPACKKLSGGMLACLG